MGLFDSYNWIEDAAAMDRQFELDMQQQATAAQQQAGGAQGARVVDNAVNLTSSGGNTFSYNLPYTYYGEFTAPPRHPHQDAHDFVYGLRSLDPTFIKEIVIMESLYNQIVLMLGYSVEKNPDIIKQLTYSLSYGNVILKNEKYQFDLDKYMEEAPVKL